MQHHQQQHILKMAKYLTVFKAEYYTPIPGYEGVYVINKETGDVVSFFLNSGKIDFNKPKLLNRRLTHKGYWSVALSYKHKKGGKHITLHRLLALTFLPNPENHPLVRHLNDVKLDNRICNLCWGTYQENKIDAIANGGVCPKKGKESKLFGKKGEDSKHAKIIIDLETGIFYFGTEGAAKAKTMNPNTLRSMLSGHLPNKTLLTYV